MTVIDFKSQVAAAELMITSGTNVVYAFDGTGWDTPGAVDGADDRQVCASSPECDGTSCQKHACPGGLALGYCEKPAECP